MRALIVQWLESLGLPGWLAPDYAVTVGVAGLLSSMAFFRLVRRDRADFAVQGYALLAGYFAAMIGGHLFEALRAVPHAIATGSFSPLLQAGRAAYGGLLAGLLVPAFFLRRRRTPVIPFLDRLVPVLGITYASVRTGCFLAGCDYGRVTAGALGVRFPAGSPAAVDHVALGWVPAGAFSLPVHPTQLYEAALGLVASAVAAVWLRRGYRDGRAFMTWLGLYAVGRFFIEILRGDVSRGIYGGLSTSQVASLVIVAAIALILARARRGPKMALALSSLAVSWLFAGHATAQPAPAPAPKPPASADASEPPAAAPPAAAAADEPPAPPAASSPPPAPPPPASTSRPPAAPAGRYPYPYPPPAAGRSPYPPGRYPYPQGQYRYPPGQYPSGQYPYPPPAGRYPYPYPYPPPTGQYPYPPQPPPYVPPPGTQPQPPPAEPPPAGAGEEEPEDETPKTNDQKEANARHMAVSLGLSGFFVPFRFTVADGGSLDLDVVARLRMTPRHRFEVGVQLRGILTADTKHYVAGVPLRFMLGVASHLEMELSVTPGIYHLVFDSPYFASTNAFGARFSWGMQFPIGSYFAFGLSPATFLMLGSSNVSLLFAYEPRLWLTVGFL